MRGGVGGGGGQDIYPHTVCLPDSFSLIPFKLLRWYTVKWILNTVTQNVTCGCNTFCPPHPPPPDNDDRLGVSVTLSLWPVRGPIVTKSVSNASALPTTPRREAGDFGCLPPVWSLRAVSLIPLLKQYLLFCSSGIETPDQNGQWYGTSIS